MLQNDIKSCCTMTDPFFPGQMHHCS